MKKNYTTAALLTCLLIISFSSTKAQTTLAPGDIAFSGYSSVAVSPVFDTFSFVLLKPITNNTVIFFTDNGWQNGGPLLSSEETISWTSAGSLPVGTNVVVYGLNAIINAVPNGTVTNVTNAPQGINLATTGDQVLAYQGSTASPTFISAIHMNVYTLLADGVDTDASTWDGAHATGTSYCYLPAGLVSTPNANPTALWFSTESDNAKLTTCFGPTANVQALRNSIYTTSNWTQTNGANGFSMLTSCFFSVAPVHLISFTASNQTDRVQLNWQVDNEINFSHYEIERSYNCREFTNAGNVVAHNYGGTFNYNFTDDNAFKNNPAAVYYRLKQVDIDGSFVYSSVVNVRNKKDLAFAVNNLVNPVKDKISFSVTTKTPGQLVIRLSDADGKIILKHSYNTMTGTTPVQLNEAAALATGLYFLRVDFDNTSTIIKLIK
ncbi:MAG: T9SS type A sorting domain-containing protein [Ferruginibacter sp.]